MTQLLCFQLWIFFPTLKMRRNLTPGYEGETLQSIFRIIPRRIKQDVRFWNNQVNISVAELLCCYSRPFIWKPCRLSNDTFPNYRHKLLPSFAWFADLSRPDPVNPSLSSPPRCAGITRRQNTHHASILYGLMVWKFTAVCLSFVPEQVHSCPFTPGKE